MTTDKLTLDKRLASLLTLNKRLTNQLIIIEIATKREELVLLQQGDLLRAGIHY